MPFQFDITMKDIIRTDPADYAASFGYVRQATRLLNVDLSTISAATDIAFGFGHPLEEILDVNFQTGVDRFLAARTEMYRSILHHKYHVPVRTLIVLLREQADHDHLTGTHSYGDHRNRVECRYDVLRMWEQPRENYLHGGVALMPLATICRVPDGMTPVASVAEVVKEMERRLTTEVEEAAALRILTAAYILTGLRLEDDERLRVFQGVGMMKKLTAWDETEQKSLAKVRRIIFCQGQLKFGPPSNEIEAQLNKIDDSDRFEEIAVKVLTANSWEELLAVPEP